MGFLVFFLKRPMLLVGVALAIAVLLFAAGCGRKGKLEAPAGYEGEAPPEERPSPSY